MMAYQKPKADTQPPDELAEKILDFAVQMAGQNSWESIRLHQVAEEMGIDLQTVQHYYRQKDDLVEAWYDRADRAMLADAAQEDYQWLTPRERIHRSIFCWLTSMQNQRKVSREMLGYKFELGHLHLQVLGLLRISRTVQWFLEAAHRDSIDLKRIGEEVVTTGIYLSTFAHWLFDDSSGAEKTAKLLDRLLSRAESFNLLTAAAEADAYRPETSDSSNQQQENGSIVH
ncbi:MAG: TetR/AcrR family transcriptional regulator [Candidatus Thiodiazotropha lotti]|nr:TetR/AcrR family transcriptional regulator [Candidatus Thiodiazotropha lotti]MCG8007898.1 TetR/AcrR family transcriptional regulator [Candidatus Thiodiazotropha lotti]MCG8011175.1 TetR/AcrR family transcriptional regulator [Candidatus Thiodiazotropha lotti]MCG8020987.1 TetR/AcrR family transcriptional regulator [Candidatus Thiodiazotropha lotti]MCW4195485.1 TetR/AcrR family transcriptional regulator [Candidatus Thiodiazotropha lotti]